MEHTGGRWGRLFADLEQQFEAEARRELDEEVADRTRRERAEIGLVDRLGWAASHPDASEVAVRLLEGTTVRGGVQDVGDGWLLVSGSGSALEGSGWLIPFAAVGSVAGLPARVGGHHAARRFGLGYALRGLARDRAVVSLLDRSGHTTVGTIDGVGSDVLDLSEHHADLARRDTNVRLRVLVPFGAIAAVRSW